MVRCPIVRSAVCYLRGQCRCRPEKVGFLVWVCVCIVVLSIKKHVWGRGVHSIEKNFVSVCVSSALKTIFVHVCPAHPPHPPSHFLFVCMCEPTTSKTQTYLSVQDGSATCQHLAQMCIFVACVVLVQVVCVCGPG